MSRLPMRRPLGRRVDDFLRNWSLPRQLAGQPHKSDAARSTLSEGLRPRLEQADKVSTTICPYCAVGCAQAAGLPPKASKSSSPHWLRRLIERLRVMKHLG